MKNKKNTYLIKKINVNNDVYYYIADAFDSEILIGDFFGNLDSEEQEKYYRYKKIEDKKMFLCSRTILREEFKSKYNFSGKSTISYTEFQKPFFLNMPDFNFNISHSAGQVMIGFSKYQVGVDIEKIVTFNKRTLIEMAKTVFSKSEVRLLELLDEISSRYLFTKIWTLKESIIKAIGTGFSYDTKLIQFNDVENLVKTSQVIDGKNVHSCFSIYNESYMTSISYIAENDF
jgi:4'-phosphopantetheinyl transferase